MNALKHRPNLPAEQRAVVTKAVGRAAEKLHVSNAQLAEVLGISVSTISRFSTTPLSRRKPIELALLLVRLYRSLLGVVGDDETAAAWLGSHNHYLEGRPVDLIQSIEGLTSTLRYLDAMRARV